jgi:glycosyl transferase family 25
MQHIDAILYINLEHRADRKLHVLEELYKLCKDSSKIHRIDAIYHEKGAIGCGLSHIKALTYAQIHPEWKSVLIVEDDFTFKSDIDIHKAISDLYVCEFDIGLPSYNHYELKYADTVYPTIKKVLFSQTASAYIIKQHYVPNLIQNMTEAVESMQLHGIRHENCIDIYWKKLIQMDKWYCIFPAIGYQYNSYSDIQHAVVEYGC